ncbi:MAG: DUF4176 domain-containing protein [Bacilli bacterium]|nr:DUF4176 domain-containing protein [Bacilli bacterium]
MLKNAEKRIMITGFLCVEKNNSEKIYDYTGCLYPEGYISADKSLLFNHDQIDKIYHLGLKDIEEEKFKQKLNEIEKNVKSN